ncbi:terpene synthase-like [Xylocopa sonorina]|uniref:terpene synthase-like n=1 Tax=Xylocopa sonorina TaxID=1818115 RepID=UPI00403A9336
MQITRGQGIELYWKDNYTCPTETEFKVMAVQKCGIVGMIARLMLLFSDYKKDITILTGLLTLYFQIRNDYYDFFVEELKIGMKFLENTSTRFLQKSYAESKGYGDLTEGYFNFLIVHAIQTGPAGEEIMNIIKRKTKSIELKRYCISLLKKYGTYAYTRSVLEELDKKIREEVEQLGGNPLFDKLLDELHNYLLV